MANGDSKFSTGLLLGLIIGGAAVYLLATDRGRRLLKAISENGLEEISHILEEVEEGAGDEYEEIEVVAENHSIPAEEENGEVPKEEVKKPLKRRFFRRIHK